MSNRSSLMQLALLALLFCSTAIVQAESEIEDDDVVDPSSRAVDDSIEEPLMPSSTTKRRAASAGREKRVFGGFPWPCRPGYCR
uniref:Uncharacterized protein n=1 Tax=Macrostomum lignano TaxID=282301 RepID=A0A1I8J6K9_9PLAT